MTMPRRTGTTPWPDETKKINGEKIVDLTTFNNRDIIGYLKVLLMMANNPDLVRERLREIVKGHEDELSDLPIK